MRYFPFQKITSTSTDRCWTRSDRNGLSTACLLAFTWIEFKISRLSKNTLRIELSLLAPLQRNVFTWIAMRDSSVRRLSLYRLLESMFEDIHCDVITGQGKSECGFAHRFSPLLFERVATFSSFHLRIRNWLSSYVRESKTVLDSGFEALNSIFH